ncbi:hypothetical protein DXG03_001153 [Asterophora parasitica]|uniref:Dol-P-Man:Man(5)GlcNAc(2)-PP-Dol alpha-1,3-mannosyltransferase n=1 Tax=Asterophora parasitica TaxID=117018 RepID=A0A9P7GCQ9_9AGAR|nr:hypothetical protein DXG03_001153 [Asterophora parasitica]
MVFNAASFVALLQALRLTQGSYKPDPDTISSFAVAGNSPFNSFVATPPTSNDPYDAQMLLDNSKNSSFDAQTHHDECFVEPYSAPPVENQVFSPYDPDKAFFYRYRQQQSVNLGSWFVHENWMSPSLFKCAAGKKLSELDIASGWGSLDSARSVLERHWDTWITEADFRYLAGIGINTVRLPIGYWNLGPYSCQDTPYASVAAVYQNSWPRIVRAINMAADNGMGVLVDLHGAVGSQNGQPHSGVSDGATNMFENPAHMDKTINALMFLMQQLSTVTNVVGIQILNEPKNVPELYDFHSRAIESMRQAPTPAAATFPLYVHNGFDLGRCTDYVANRADFIVQDHHSYFVFTPSDEAEPASDHTNDIQGPIADNLAKASAKQRKNLVIDEWSCALTPKSIENEPDKEAARRDFCKGQMDVYADTTAGWSFWCKRVPLMFFAPTLTTLTTTAYLKEGCDEDPGWCFKAAVNRSLPATFFSFNQGPITDPWQKQVVSTAIANVTVPSTSEILSGSHSRRASPAPSGKFTRHSFGGKAGTSDYYVHRFEAIHDRRLHTRDNHSDLTDEQKSSVKGHIDGFNAAKSFAMFDISKLGFVGQYVADSLSRLGPGVVAPGTEQNYRDGFGQGLVAGQEKVMAILNQAPNTEIDWKTYMVQTEVYLKGQHNYTLITGPTGPLVYPAGHLRIHEYLYHWFDAGANLELAQRIYAGLYLLTLTLTIAIYHKAGNIPNWVLLILPLSKRLHSIFVLRLFNDSWAVLAVNVAILFFQYGLDETGTVLYSAALSIKMSNLLYLPGLLLILFKRRGFFATLRHIFTIVAIQTVLASPFIGEDPWAYVNSAFDLSRAFLYKWTVNWRFVSEETFLSSQWATGLLAGHVVVLVLFGLFRWCRADGGGALGVLGRGLLTPTVAPSGVTPLTGDYVATVLFTSKLIGIIFARSLHYQFYSWYAFQVPFLAWRSPYPFILKLALVIGVEYAWNVFPSTNLSSSVLLGANSLLLLGIWLRDEPKADVKIKAT